MDHLLDFMKELAIEPTRERYLNLEYFGNPPAQLSAEEESMLPEQFQNISEADEPDEVENPEPEE